MILGLLSFPCVCSLFTGLPAILFAILALLDIGKSGGRLGGKVLAWLGLVTGCLGTLCVAPGLGYVYFVTIPDARARVQEQNNLKQIGLAMHNFNDTNMALPQATAYRSADGKPLLSWRVAILPYVEQSNLYAQFRIDEPWDSPHNSRLQSMMPRIYAQPGEKDTSSGLTRYQVLVGSGTAFEERPMFPPRSGLQLGMKIPMDFQDGTSNTILVVLADEAVPWTKPVDLRYDPTGPLPRFSKRFSGGFNVGLADGSVRMVSHSISEPTLRNAITRNDGNILGPDW
jgi:prepilin-type processing-associated H-X9-DG protein